MTFDKMPRGNYMFRKVISLIILFTFAVSNFSFAATSDIVSTKVKKEVITDPEKIVISRDAGLVKSKFTGNKEKLVIHIQDAHCNYEAQSNIAKILESLIKNDGLTFVSVEGADGLIDTSWFKSFPDDEVRREVADYFMKKGEITGPEFLSITTDYPIKLFGAETRAYYIQNLNAFTSSYPLKEPTEKYLNQIKTVLNRLKNFIYNEGLKEMDVKAADYESKKLQFNDYVKFLQAMAEKHKINLRAYDNFFKLVSVLVYEKKIDFTVTDKERSALIDDLSRTMPKDTLTELVGQSVAFKTGKISSADFYSYLKKLAIAQGIDIQQKYPNLYNYIIYNSVYSRIENEKLFGDIKDLEIAIKEKLFHNDNQRTLEKLSRHIDTLLGLVNIKLLNDDFDYYKAHREEFTHDTFASFIKAKTIQFGLAYDIMPPDNTVSKSMADLEDFYVIAIKRDKALVDNTIAAMNKDGQKIGVLITGGFHSEGITKLLEKSGVSYMVVCPSITKDVPTPYIQILTNQRTPLENILVAPAHAKEQTGSLAAPVRSWCMTLSDREFAELEKQLDKGKDLKISIDDLEDNWIRIYINGAEPGIENGIVIGAVDGYIDHVLTNFGGRAIDIVENFKEQLRERARVLNRQGREILLSKVEKQLASLDDAKIREKIERAMISAARAKAKAQAMAPAAEESLINTIQEKFRAEITSLLTAANVVGRTPGTGAVKESSLNAPYTNDEAGAIGKTIRDTILAGESREVFEHRTGGVFVVLDDAAYEDAARRHGSPLDVACHPGTRGTKAFYDPADPDTYTANVKRFYYIKASIYNALTTEEKLVFAMHEEAHIKAALGILNIPQNVSEERFINMQAGSDVRPIMARLGSVAHMMDILITDTSYGTAAKNEIERLTRSGDRAALEQFVKTVYFRRVNIDRMKQVLTEEPYRGYDIIIISSTTPDEAEYQQKVLERVLSGIRTDNSELNNKVCVLSVLDESEGGQIIGQVNTWLRARKAYEQWAAKNGVRQNNLDNLFASGKGKIAIYHNGGKGERASPATQSLGNSRGAQQMIGTALSSKGEKIPIELILGVVLSTNPLALTNDGSRIDTIWANQIAFGTIDATAVRRTNFLFDKFVIKMPSKPREKDVHDYGAAKVLPDGGLDKFYANKTFAQRNAKTGKYELVDGLKGEFEKLLSEGGSYDYGSFSISRALHYALLEYWISVRHIDQVMRADKDGRAGISRDIDPAFVQIVVPMVRGIAGNAIPALPTALQLDQSDTATKEALLSKACESLLSAMGSEYAHDLAKVYGKNKAAVLETIEIFIRFPVLFRDLGKVVGSIDLGADSYWFAYKRLLDMANEKFLMLSDLLGHTIELETNGAVTRAPLTIEDAVKAEDTRRVRKIYDDAVAVFEVAGVKISLTAEQVKKGWKGHGVLVKGSVIQGNTVLLPGSVIVDSVINDSQGMIKAKNSYVESATAPRIKAINSIVFKAIDAQEVSANRQIVADAYRPAIQDARFPEGQTRMRAPIGYDPKPTDKVLAAQMSDTVKFGDNVYTFQEIREMKCDRSNNDIIEHNLRIKAFVPMMAEQLTGPLSTQHRLAIWANAYVSGILADVNNADLYSACFWNFGINSLEQGSLELSESNVRKQLAYTKLIMKLVSHYTRQSYADEFGVSFAVAEKEVYGVVANAVMKLYGEKNPKVAGFVAKATENLTTWMTDKRFAEYQDALKDLVVLAQTDTASADELFDSFYKLIKFGTGGRRGKVGIGPNRINPYMIALTAQGHADYLLQRADAGTIPGGRDALRSRGVIIGYDVRDFKGFFKPTMDTGKISEYYAAIAPVLEGYNSKKLSLTAAEVYAANGIKAYVPMEVRSTPWTSFATRRLHTILGTEKKVGDGRAVAGVVMSSSHNQPDNNGSKFYEEDGGQAPPFLAQEIVNAGNKVSAIIEFDRNDENQVSLVVRVKGADLRKIDDVFHRHSKEEADMLRTQKNESKRKRSVVAFHAMNGTGDTALADALKRDGYTEGVTLLRAKDDTHDYAFSSAYNNTPNPEVDQSFDATIALGMEYDLKRLTEYGAKIIDKTRRGFAIDMTGVEQTQREEIMQALLLCQVALTTDPDADRIGIALKRIQTLPDGKVKIRWVTANDNDEAGIILFKYVIDAWMASDKLQGKKPFAVTTVVSNKLEEQIAANNKVTVLRHPVGFKFTGEAVTFINNRTYGEVGHHVGIVEKMMRELGIKEEDLGNLGFIISFEEGEGGLIGSTGAADKDSGVIGMAVTTLAEDMLALDEPKTIYDYLLDIYRTEGYAKSYLEPIVLDGADGDKMIGNIQKAIQTDYEATRHPDGVAQLTELAGIRIDWSKTRYYLKDYGAEIVAAEKESLEMIEFALDSVSVKDRSGKDIELRDIRVLFRPSGTEPKSKIWCYVGSKPLGADASNADLQEQMRIVDEWHRKILDAALIYAYRQTGAEYSGYSVNNLNPSEEIQLLRIDFNTALRKKLDSYFPMMLKAREYANDIVAGRRPYNAARAEIEKITKQFSSAEKENLVKASVGIALQDDVNNGLAENLVLMQSQLIFGEERGSRVYDMLMMINNPAFEQLHEEASFKARALFGDVEGEIFLREVSSRRGDRTLAPISSFSLTTRTPGTNAIKSDVTLSQSAAPDAGQIAPQAADAVISINDMLDNYGTITDKAIVRNTCYEMARKALEVADAATAVALQVVAGQTLAIMTLIDQNIPGAEKLRFTADVNEMIINEKGRSYISKQSAIDSGIGIAPTEGAEGLYWRGSEGIKKLGNNIIQEAVYDQARFNEQAPKMVMYTMLHIGGYHTTVFLHDYLPGSIQHTSTGPGHLQVNAEGQPVLDMKHVVSGYGIQWTRAFDASGNVTANIAHPISAGSEDTSWADALPGSYDAMENLGGLIFNDFSLPLVRGIASGNMGTAPTIAGRMPAQAFSLGQETVYLAGSPMTVYAGATSVPVSIYKLYQDTRANTGLRNAMLAGAEDMKEVLMDTNGPQNTTTIEDVTRAAEIARATERGEPVRMAPKFNLGSMGYKWGEPAPASYILRQMGKTAVELGIKAGDQVAERIIATSTGASQITAKVLASAMPLSVQLHTFSEMIVPLEAGTAYLGLKDGMTADQLIEAAMQGKIADVMNKVTLAPGVPIIVPAYVPHAYDLVKVYEVKAVTPEEDRGGTISFFDRLKFLGARQSLVMTADELRALNPGREVKDVLTMSADQLAKTRAALVNAEENGGLQAVNPNELAFTPAKRDIAQGDRAQLNLLGMTDRFVTGQYEVEEGGSITIDAVQQEKETPLFVEKGAVTVVAENGESFKVNAGEDVVLPAGKGAYKIVGLEGPATVYTEYVPTNSEQFVVNVFNALKRELARPDKRAFTMWVPQELYNGETFRMEAGLIKQISNGNVTLRQYSDLGSIQPDLANDVIIAPNDALQKASESNPDSIRNMLSSSRMLTVDGDYVEKLKANGRIMGYAREVESLGVILGNTKPEDIAARTTRATDLYNILNGRTLQPITMDNLLDLFGRGPDAIADRLTMLLRHLPLMMPIDVNDMDKAIQARRQALWSA